MKTNNYKDFTAFVFSLFISLIAHTQDTLHFIQNPSFEDQPSRGGYYNNAVSYPVNPIEDWFDCGKLFFPNETSPDIHGKTTKYWNIKQNPSHGETFLSLTLRDNYTWESLSQELLQDVEQGKCYSFTLDLCRSDSYMSGSRLFKESASFLYVVPAVLMVWAGDELCVQDELLYKTTPIKNKDWQSYEIKFSPKKSYKYISIEAYYEDVSKIENGHILIDNISPFIVTECKD